MTLAIANVFIRSARITTGTEQVFVRFLVQAIAIGSFIIHSKRSFFGPKESRILLLIRGSLGTLSILFLHLALKLIDPSDAVALFHLNAVIVSIIARFLLKEKISLAHLICLVMSMLGVMFISQPSFIFKKQSKSLMTNFSLNGTSFNYSNINHNDTSIDQIDSTFIIGISLGEYILM